jgi:UDP-3-O-acyl-N-acetylglucosamine deacetylase
MIAKIKSQQTLKKQVKLKGVGLHTGEQIQDGLKSSS